MLPLVLSQEGCASLEVECEAPDKSLYYFAGKIILKVKDSVTTFEASMKQFLHSVSITNVNYCMP